jgi:hypothetical protein
VTTAPSLLRILKDLAAADCVSQHRLGMLR